MVFSDAKFPLSQTRRTLFNPISLVTSSVNAINARISKMPKYPVIVRFKDDPQEYVYTNGGGEWLQVIPDPISDPI